MMQSSAAPRILLACLAVAVASPAGGDAQTTVRAAKIGAFVPYGLDAVRLRVIRAIVVRGAATLPAAMRANRSGQPIGGNTGYVALALEVRNDGAIPENIPLLQATLDVAGGVTIDPAVYGPFVGSATVEAPSSTTIAPHRTLRLRIFVGDVPHDRRVRDVVLSPNDATAAYRFDVGRGDVAPIP